MGIQLDGVNGTIKTGSSNVHNTGYNGQDGVFTGDLTVTGNIGVAGTLTYEDVTNVDSVGLITARTGIKIGPSAGVAGTFFADGSYITAGILTATNVSAASSVTATTYYGSGANLTGISAGAGGDTPLDLNDGVKANFGADDDLRIYAGSGNSFIKHQDTAAGDLYIDAEASNVYIRSGDGGTGAQDAIVCQSNNKIQFKHAGTTIAETATNGIAFPTDKGLVGDSIHITAVNGNYIAKLHTTNSQEFYFNNSKKLEVNNTGINVTGNVTPSSGIYLGGSGGSNHMDDYEEGSFVAKAYQGGSAITLSYHNTHGRYTKVGNMVTVWMWVRASGTTSSTGGMQIGGLPFTSNSNSYRPSITGRAYGLRNFSGNSGINFWMNGSSSVIEVVTIDGNGLAQASNTSNNVWTGGAEVHATFSYFV